jgi:hypothetical protein
MFKYTHFGSLERKKITLAVNLTGVLRYFSQGRDSVSNKILHILVYNKGGQVSINSWSQISISGASQKMSNKFCNTYPYNVVRCNSIFPLTTTSNLLIATELHIPKSLCVKICVLHIAFHQNITKLGHSCWSSWNHSGCLPVMMK